MSLDKMLPAVPDEDSPHIDRARWLTPRHLTVFVIGWLVLFGLLSVFISNPFQSEISASATPDYARVMFLHGLLIGMVGLAALLTLNVMRISSLHVRLWITGGVVVATILAAVGGIWDRTIPGSEVPMWTQIAGFFALDEILILLVVGLVREWIRKAPLARSLPYIAATCAAVSMFLAALMGHLAGWIMEFGNVPSALGNFAHFASYASLDDFAGSLVGSHSHEMAVGSIALVISILAVQFGYHRRQGIGRTIARIGMAMVALGTVVMTMMYVWSALANWSLPTLFVSGPGGANGIASDDVVTGILVMGGGLLVAVSLVLVRSWLRRPVRLAAAWAWLLSFATVVVAGFAIEMNEAYFGAGDPTAQGAVKDAVFTWMHQDIVLFLFPTIALVMLAVERLINPHHPVRHTWIGWTAMVGTTITFVGGLIFVFVDPALHGVGYVISTAGLLIVGAMLLATIWWAAISGYAPSQPTTTPPVGEETRMTSN